MLTVARLLPRFLHLYRSARQLLTAPRYSTDLQHLSPSPSRPPVLPRRARRPSPAAPHSPEPSCYRSLSHSLSVSAPSLSPSLWRAVSRAVYLCLFRPHPRPALPCPPHPWHGRAAALLRLCRRYNGVRAPEDRSTWQCSRRSRNKRHEEPFTVRLAFRCAPPSAAAALSHSRESCWVRRCWFQ
jgi:hypothetical protein